MTKPHDSILRIKSSVRFAMKRIRFLGGNRFCPICRRHARRFLVANRVGTFGTVPRPEARCPFCYSMERHRMLWRYLQERTNFFQLSGIDMLHIAPERCFESRLRQQIGRGYLTADLFHPADMKIDISATQLPSNSFDIVCCSHVLEHIPDDRAAMREICRVLKPSGWAIFMVPITVDVTIEDPTIADPRERERRFGQHDHVRRYGRDFMDRLEEAGFLVEITHADDFLTSAEIARIGVASAATGEVFRCTRA